MIFEICSTGGYYVMLPKGENPVTGSIKTDRRSSSDGVTPFGSHK
jgi:hypothetical protein